jgi:hypothetical protein
MIAIKFGFAYIGKYRRFANRKHGQYCPVLPVHITIMLGGVLLLRCSILQRTARKAPVIHAGDELAFLLWRFGWGWYVGSSHAK